MQITILAAGSRGDVQPYIALARGLNAAGHSVTLGAPANFAAFVQQHGINFAPLRADYYQLMDSKEGHDLKSGNPLRVMQQMKTVIFPLMRRLLDDSYMVSHGADLLIYHPKLFGTPHIAEKLNIPACIAMPVPVMTPTSEFPAPGVLTRSLGPTINRASYGAMNLALRPFNGMIAEWRRDVLRLPAQSSAVKGQTLRGEPIPILYGFSSHVLPRPHDWPEWAHVTGYWFLDSEHTWQPPAALLEFLADDPPPVYVGFGSMVAENAEQVTQTVIDAIRQSGQRAILASGWGGLRDIALPPSIYQLTEAPHDWLFPRMAAVVHHGGAGTVAAGLRAGKPTVVVSFLADQPFWGQVVQRLGVGPQPLAIKTLRADALAGAIRLAAEDRTMRDRAQAVGERIRAEDGVANAVAVVHGLLKTSVH